MSLTLQKDLLCLGETNDGGMNYDTCTIPLIITKQYVNEEYEVVVEGLRDEGAITLSEIKSLLEDMEYLNNKN